MVQQFAMRLHEARMIAPSVRHLVFRRDDGQALSFVPGQFLQVHFNYDDGTPTRRSYSIATRIEAGQRVVEDIEIAVSYVEGGAATRLLSNLEPGETILTSGPFGRFVLMEADLNARYLLLATGTGITPFRSMLSELERQYRQRGIEVVLLHGARNGDELLYAAEFEAFATQHPWFRHVPCLSRQARRPAGRLDRRGHVQDALTELVPQAAHDIAYLCGNPNMVDASFEALKAAGLPVSAIRREKYVSSR